MLIGLLTACWWYAFEVEPNPQGGLLCHDLGFQIECARVVSAADTDVVWFRGTNDEWRQTIAESQGRVLIPHVPERSNRLRRGLNPAR